MTKKMSKYETYEKSQIDKQMHRYSRRIPKRFVAQMDAYLDKLKRSRQQPGQ